MSRVQTLPKQPPSSIDGEQAVLGALLQMGDRAAVTVFGLLAPEDFYRTEYQTIAGAIHALHQARKAHDLIAVTDYLRDRGLLEQAGGALELGRLAFDGSSFANLEAHAQIVRDKAQRRRVIALCDAVGQAAYGREAGDLTGMLTAGTETLLRASGTKARKFAELLGATEDYLRVAKERRKAGGVLGVSTGLPALDKITGGIYGSRVYGVAARPGTGKTALLNQIALRAAIRGEPGLVVSLEMGAEELMVRALSAHAKQNVTRLFHAHEAETDAAFRAAAGLGDLPLWLDTETTSLNAIMAQIAAHKHRYGIQWAAVDHVGLIQTEKFSNRNDQIGHITANLKHCAKRLGIPIIALLQMSRYVERDDRWPELHDLRDSGNIEQDLDVAIFLHVEKKHRDQPVRPVKVGVLKNRSGRSAWLSEQFQFDGAVQTFSEIAQGYDAPRPYSEPPEVPL